MSLSPLPLSYCTNVHPGRTMAEVEAGLDRYTVPVQKALGRAVGAGLWFAEPVAGELIASEKHLCEFGDRLRARGLGCYTLNAFPYGDFHKSRVKEQVYLPDWSSAGRMKYTAACAAILASLLPPEAEGSISTLPLGFKPFAHDASFLDSCILHLLDVVSALNATRQRTGKTIRLAIEPEPFCLLETTAETIGFFERLWQAAARNGWEEIARRHIGVCYDVCHQAVEFEDAAESIRALDAAGIRINKVQISCALELADPTGREALRPYIEPRYLHQTMARGNDGRIARAVDLNEALLSDPPAEFASASPWRVHFHVPVSAERMGPIGTTRHVLGPALRAIKALDYAPHLEVETYTWNVLPGAQVDLVAGLTEELRATQALIDGLE
jgi:sugar phosphate isomerase/epimerase